MIGTLRTTITLEVFKKAVLEAIPARGTHCFDESIKHLRDLATRLPISVRNTANWEMHEKLGRGLQYE